MTTDYTPIPLPPGGLMEIVFSFDTTGSMSSILDEVRARVQDMIQRLQADIPGIRMGIIAHGDYCDKDVYYLTVQQDLTNDITMLCDFLKNVGGTGGGDPDECYELVLKKVHEDFSWTAGSQKVLVLIGDANPHAPDYEMNEENIDWLNETQKLAKMGVKIYGVQAFENEGVDEFYKTLAEESDGHYVKLGEFSNICDFLMAICYRERDENLFMNYEAEVRSRARVVNPEIDHMFGTLRKNLSTSSNKSNPAVATVVPMPRLAPVVEPPKIVTVKERRKRGQKTDATATKRNRKTVAAAKTVPIAKMAVKKEEMKKRREVIPNAAFTCNTLDWSSWKLAYQPNTGETRNGFRLVNKGECLKRKNLFQDSSKKNIVFEISVQTEAGKKRRVMFFNSYTGHFNSSHWEHSLLRGGRKRLLRQIYTVVLRGCKVFVRRAFVNKKHEQKKVQALDEYDYAWSIAHEGRDQRNVCVDGTYISNVRMSIP